MPRTVVQVLQERGYDTTSVIEQGMGGWKDLDLWGVLQEEKIDIIQCLFAFQTLP